MKTKSTSQMTRELTKKSPIFLTLAALVLCASPVIALADDCLGGQTYWNVQSGDWFVGMNWIGGVPNLIMGASINNGGTATIGRTGAESCDLTLGGAATESGTLVVDHGGLNISFDAAVGGYGKGVLTIKNGGTVNAALASIAAIAGSNGAATVDGTSSQWALGGELDIGAGGTGLLTVTNGGTVTATNVHVYGSGTLTGNGTVTSGVTVDGTLEPSGGTLSITGTGNLTLHRDSTTLCNVVTSGADNVDVSASGGAFLDGRLTVIMNGTSFTPGTRYALLTADPGGLHNTAFFSISIKYAPPSQCFTPVVTYDTKHVYLYLQPCTS